MHNKTLRYLRGERDVAGRSNTSGSESAPTKSFGEKLKKRQQLKRRVIGKLVCRSDFGWRRHHAAKPGGPLPNLPTHHFCKNLISDLCSPPDLRFLQNLIGTCAKPETGFMQNLIYDLCRIAAFCQQTTMMIPARMT